MLLTTVGNSDRHLRRRRDPGGQVSIPLRYCDSCSAAAQPSSLPTSTTLGYNTVATTTSTILLIHLFAVLTAAATPVDAMSAAGLPCVFEGHLRTDKNWFGYLANISVVTTARMTFEFQYAADRCCQNVLFYTEDQTSIISARMNCWQKEYLLRPEDDQILRLTPRFSWSGCHMTHPGGLPTYQCEGGRSFTVEQQQQQFQPMLSHGSQSHLLPSVPALSSRPSTWYVAASNCAALNGLDLRYRLVVYGHVGDCTATAAADGRSGSTARSSTVQRSSLHAENDGGSAAASHSSDDDDVIGLRTSCQLEGDVNVTSSWHGFLANMTLARGGGFRFRFRYQAVSTSQTVRVLLYRVEDLSKLSAEQTCWQKDGVIRQRNEPEQVIVLSAQSSWNGCISTAGATGEISSSPREISCQGERRYDEPRRLHVALSDCYSAQGIRLHYRLDVYGFTNHEELCSGAVATSSWRRRAGAYDAIWRRTEDRLVVLLGAVVAVAARFHVVAVVAGG
jgi:hypothetical protein